MEKTSLASALAKAQAKFVQPEKNKTVTVQPKKRQDGSWPEKYTFDYADYNAIVEAVRGPLSANGVAFTHVVELRGDRLLLVTKLIHGESGESIESIWPLTNSSDPKEVGGDMTYGKRYSLSAITGCVADDDADAPGPAPESFKDRKPSSAPVNPNKVGAPKASATSPIKPPVKSPDEYILTGKLEGQRIDSMDIGQLEEWKQNADAHFQKLKVDPYNSTSDTAKTYRAVYRAIESLQPSMFEKAPNGPVTG